MATIDLTDDTFEKDLAAADMAVVDFYASWCGPCMMFKPKFARLSDEYTHVRFFVCDGEKAPNARRSVEIGNLPYFGFYRNGKLQGGLSTSKEEGFREELEKHFGPASTGSASGGTPG